MPNPKKKHTRSRRDLRRSHNSVIEVPQLVECPNCKSMRLPHNVCPSCGFYKDHVVVAQKAAEKEEAK
ncbi:MAG: 50S ribosomal protein L32 [Elusimicrobiaceae bacterium]|nr:50S ribosomal protein L32 [Elusimicrobiaceae bacterium]MBR3898942.1 50S ribosomal protein L32 [Elusimicrobiaceae bacterium]